MALCPCCPSNSSNNLAGVATGASAMPVPSSTRCPAGPLLQPSPSPRRPRRQVPRPAGAFSSLARPSPRAPLVAHELRDPDGHFVSLVAAVDSQASTLPPPADALRHPGGVEHRVVVLGRCRLPLFFTGSGITSPDPLPPPTSIHQATPASLRPPPGHAAGPPSRPLFLSLPPLSVSPLSVSLCQGQEPDEPSCGLAGELPRARPIAPRLSSLCSSSSSPAPQVPPAGTPSPPLPRANSCAPASSRCGRSREPAPSPSCVDPFKRQRGQPPGPQARPRPRSAPIGPPPLSWDRPMGELPTAPLCWPNSAARFGP
nr:proline-rich receptor-like protein kinase PERK2 isoform X2 [Aegilops tauschii subsp. strangulata]